MDIIIPDNTDEIGAAREAGVMVLMPGFARFELLLAEEAYVILQCCASAIDGGDISMCISRAAELLGASPDSVRLAGSALGRCLDIAANRELRDIYAEASSLVMTGWRP